MSYDPDEMMLELFRAEVESHSDSLTNSLLKLEQDPEASSVLDGMMRAAHSIKGAARIVRVDPAVEVAHAMEDCFVAAQRGELVLEPGSIDVLLRAVDLLVQISEASKKSDVEWATFDSTIQTIVEQLRCVLTNQPIQASLLASLATPAEIQSGESKAGEIQSTPSPAAPSPASLSPASPSPAEPSPAEPGPAEPSPENKAGKVFTQVHRLVLPRVLDRSNAEPLRVQLLAMLDQYEVVCLDFETLQDLDAIGLAWLDSASRYAKKQGKVVSAINAAAPFSPILELVGLLGSGDK